MNYVQSWIVWGPCLAMLPMLRDHKILVNMWLDSGYFMKSSRSQCTGSDICYREEEKHPRIRALGDFRVPCSRKYLKQAHHSGGEGNGNPLQYPCLENPMDGPGRL